MKVLEGQEPASVLGFFEELCGIPHGSTNTKQISDYIVQFAKDRGLDYYQDDMNNVIIYKDANLPNGGEASEPIILQGHIDMVCEKEAGFEFDFEKEGLRVRCDNGVISAEGTTLGADDGIGVAYMMAILDSDKIVHPPLECVFTVDEEIGMLGAAGLDMTKLKGKTLMNIDSEDEGHLLVSCAGGALVQMKFPINRRGAQGKRYKISVSGLLGGHSGIEIDKGRANADMLLARVLRDLLFVDDSLRIISIQGGFKDNAIPSAAEAIIVAKDYDGILAALEDTDMDIRSEYAETDPGIQIKCDPLTAEEEENYSGVYPLDEMVNLSLVMAFSSLPTGIQTMSKDIEGLVQTSLNLGILKTHDDSIEMSFCVRSSVEREKEELMEQLSLICKSAGGTIDVSGPYPAWEYKADSRLRDIMTSTYEKMFNKPMIVEAVHAGLECGIFAGAISGLDAVSFGPDILDIHTPKEMMYVDSVERTWNFIVEVLGQLV